MLHIWSTRVFPLNPVHSLYEIRIGMYIFWTRIAFAGKAEIWGVIAHWIAVRREWDFIAYTARYATHQDSFVRDEFHICQVVMSFRTGRSRYFGTNLQGSDFYGIGTGGRSDGGILDILDGFGICGILLDAMTGILAKQGIGCRYREFVSRGRSWHQPADYRVGESVSLGTSQECHWTGDGRLVQFEPFHARN